MFFGTTTFKRPRSSSPVRLDSIDICFRVVRIIHPRSFFRVKFGTKPNTPEQICNQIWVQKKTPPFEKTAQHIIFLFQFDHIMERSSIRQSIHVRAHELKYRIRFYVASARCYHYSDSHNPRILQTRRPNGPFVTLRLVPNDQYLLRQGEYLTLEIQDPAPDPSSRLIKDVVQQPPPSNENLIDLESELPYPRRYFPQEFPNDSSKISSKSFYNPIGENINYLSNLEFNSTALTTPISQDQIDFNPLSDETVYSKLPLIGSTIRSNSTNCPYPPQLAYSYSQTNPNSNYYPSIRTIK